MKIFEKIDFFKISFQKSIKSRKKVLFLPKKLLSSGELVIFPTETVFGLGADATNDEAVKSIFKVKKRPRANPIICHFKSIKQIEKYFILNNWQFRT